MLKKLFKKNENQHGKYFEVWGDLLAHSNMLKYVLIGAVLCNLIQLFFIFILANKPPMIIRIDKLGNVAQTKNYVAESLSVTEEDIRDFARKFIENYTAVRSDRVTYQMKEALNMMTSDYQKLHLKNLKDSNIIEEVQVADIKNEAILKEMSVDISNDNVYVRVDGMIKTSSLSLINDEPAEKPFIAKMILKKVRKTGETPFGLLVSGYKLNFGAEPTIGTEHFRKDEDE